MAKTPKTSDFPFPQDLLDAQGELHQVRSQLSTLYKQLPCSVEPLPGWSHRQETGGSYYASERPDSPGWSDEEKRQVEALRARQLELVTIVFVHPFWTTCDDAVTARAALKHAHEQASDAAA